MLDPVTGVVLDRGWQPLQTMPPLPSKEGDKDFVCLVIVGDDDPAKPTPLTMRVHVAVYHPNIVTIGGRFDFDMPPIIAWKPFVLTPER